MKKLISLLLCAIMLLGTIPAVSFAEEAKPPKLSESEYSNEVFKDGYTYYVLTPEQINKGGWIVSTSASTESFRSSIMESKASDDATVEFVVPKDDIYTVFVHSRSYSTHRPFDVFADGKHIGTAGTHGTDGWNWQRFEQVVLNAGTHTLSFNDQGSQYRRFDFILVTNDPEFYPDNKVETLTALEQNYLFDASKIEVIPSNPAEGRPSTDIAVKFNGNWMNFDVDPLIINSRTMVPLRAIFEALGATVTWDGETATARATRNGKNVAVTIGSNIAVVDGEAVTIDQSASLINGRTLVPLRFVSEAFGADVQWLADSRSVIINAIIPMPSFYITADSYYTYGSWEMQSQKGAAVEGAGILIGLTKYVKDIKPAIAQLKVEHEGDYRIWVRARDFATNQQGTRFFDVKVNGGDTGRTYGQHGKDGFRWEDGGIVHLNAGINTVEVHDSSAFYARLAGIFLTQDVNAAPPSFDYQEIIKKATPWNALASISEELFPAWAKQDVTPTETATIESATTKVNFYKVPDANRGTVVQNEIFVKDGNEWVLVKDRTDEFGYLAIRSDYSALADSVDEYVTTEVKFTRDGTDYMSVTKNLYKMGDSEWLIPNGWNVIGNNKIQLTFAENPNFNFSATWEMDNIEDSPKVTISADIKNNGYYSFVSSNGKEHTKEALDAVTIPYRITEKRISTDPGIVIETQLTAPLGLVTVNENGRTLTQGISADSSVVSDGAWVRDYSSEFGIGGIGVSGGYKATIAAPIMGSTYSNLSAGQNYTFAYRVINQLAGWHEGYMHVVEDIMNVHDYRNNYYQNTNETIFNITDLMLDDIYGGWDDYGKGHWNMEGQGVSTLLPLVAVQRYMLTEDETLLNERVIPTMSAMLTRTQRNFKRSLTTGGAMSNYVKGDSLITEIGTPKSEYIANTYYGWYLMSNGTVPAFNEIANTRAKNDKYEPEKFENVLSAITLYKQSGKKEDLDAAIAAGDAYIKYTLEDVAYMSDVMRWSGFVNQYYYPNIGTFIDLYELSGEKRFLDAAQESANILTTTLDTYGLTGDLMTTDRVITREQTVAEQPTLTTTSGYYWHGDTKWRVGWPYGEYGPMIDAPAQMPETQTVPGWLPTTVGLGIENATTYTEGGQIVLSTWVGDLNRLAYYTGEDFYNICTRNTIIGRYTNYPGYYIRAYMAHYMDKNYPYEGPDYTNIYWHHIPIVIGQLEEFLISDAFYQSGSKIEFPRVRQTGYAYFYSNHYGFQPGKIYDVDGLWLWNDRGIVSPDSKQLDYLPAKKDGTLAVAFMNRDSVATTSTITLGEKIEGGAAYSGTATLYDADGNKSTVEVSNGKFTITVPAKGMMTVVMNNIGVKAPAFADESFKVTDLEVGATVSDHSRGRGYTLQLAPDKYYAYIYVTDLDAAVYDGKDTTKQYTKSITVTYTVDGKTEKVVRDTYPFEVVIPVDNVDAEFKYSVSAVRLDDSVEELGSGTLMTAKKSKELGIKYKGEVYSGKQEEAVVSTAPGDPNLKEFKPFVIKYTNQGMGSGALRFAVEKEQIPFDCTENLLKECVVKLKGTELATGKVEESITTLSGNEVKDNGSVILKVRPTDAYPLGSYDNSQNKTHTFEITIYMPGTALVPAATYYVDPVADAEQVKEVTMPEFEPFNPEYLNMGTKNKLLRFGTSGESYPFEVSNNTLKGAKVKLVAKAIDGGKDFTVETVLEGNEVSGNKIILLVAPTEEMPYQNYLSTHKFEITISQPDK